MNVFEVADELKSCGFNIVAVNIDLFSGDNITLDGNLFVQVEHDGCMGIVEHLSESKLRFYPTTHRVSTLVRDLYRFTRV